MKRKRIRSNGKISDESNQADDHFFKGQGEDRPPSTSKPGNIAES